MKITGAEIRRLIIEEIELNEIGDSPWLDPEITAVQSKAHQDELSKYPGRVSLTLDWVQNALMVLGFAGPVGPFADGINATISLARGNWIESVLFAIAIIPGGPEAAATGLNLVHRFLVKPFWPVIKSGGTVTRSMYITKVNPATRKAMRPLLFELKRFASVRRLKINRFFDAMKKPNWISWWDDAIKSTGGKYKSFDELPAVIRYKVFPYLKAMQTTAAAAAGDAKALVDFLSKMDVGDWYQSERFEDTPGNIITGAPKSDEPIDLGDYALQEIHHPRLLRVVLDEEYSNRHIDTLLASE